MEQVNAASFPVAIPRITVVAMFTREAADPAVAVLGLEIHIGAQQLFNGPLNVNFVQQFQNRTVAEIQGFVVPSPGNLSFILKNGAEVIASWTVVIAQIGEPAFQLPLAMNPAAPPNPVQ